MINETDVAPEAGRVLTRGFGVAQRILIFTGSAIVIVGGWWWIVASRDISPLLLPSPGAVWQAIIDFRGLLVDSALVSLQEIAMGFALAATVGLLLAIAITYSRVLNAVFYMPLVMLYSMPKVALGPLLLVWFGFGMITKVLLSFLIAFFPVVIQTSVGLQSVDPDLRGLARSLHASGFKRFLKIDLPVALPSYFAGLKVAMTLAVLGAIVGEFLVGGEGLGYLLQAAIFQHLISLAFATTLIVAAISMTLFAILEGVRRLVTARW